MQSQIRQRFAVVLREAVVAALLLGACLGLSRPVVAALESGVYQTLPGATVEESGDRVANGSRAVPFSATLVFDLKAIQPTLSARITDAVLEGGSPFALTVQSSAGEQSPDGTYRFTGDYLRDLYPSGSQYQFDWSFSTSADGRIVWNGISQWTGGHIWQVTISNLTVVPLPQLSISRAGTGTIQIAWATNFAGYILEHATNLSATAWSPVTNAPATVANRAIVTVDNAATMRFYRLRKP